jgi:radical SAM superfamily enzyme YgiQ (UPF0313 family)
LLKKAMPQRLLLITPPFTQLNTPYPATAYIKGFLNTLNIFSHQADIGIEVINKLFSRPYLEIIFDKVKNLSSLDDNAKKILSHKKQYLKTIDSVMSFLRGQNPTLAYQICDRNYLPEASRFTNVEEPEYFFGTLGIIDQAKHFCTLYLEDIGDLITQYIDPNFGFNRYAESLARTASDFGPILAAVTNEDSIVSKLTIDILSRHIASSQPTLVCISVPFPGNLYSALKCAQYIKKTYPQIATCIGGGYVNTELRSIADERFFNYFDYVSLDDGEAPLASLIEYLDSVRDVHALKRIFKLHHGVVQFFNGATEKDIAQRDTGTPDYSDLYLTQYISTIETTNPMHRMWSDGRWNKLTLAHGCYWGKCSFCDISLDYISRYEPINATILCDRIETIMAQTGTNGFHFVDEAAPPALMGELALEIINRNLDITWWTNIRFEKSFTYDLCKLLRASGCVAVSGGLEVASDRLLALMQKGVTIAQVSCVADAFTKAGIMVHAYLMYGFPTQTDQETIDSLEVVRQLFQTGVIQSGFWHRFAMTAHSPVGLYPEKYNVHRTGPIFDGFAENDLYHDDPQGCNHDLYSEGLRISLYNYMNNAGLDLPLQHWFEHKVPKSSHPKNLIVKYLNHHQDHIRSNAKVYYLGIAPKIINTKDGVSMVFSDNKNEYEFELDQDEAKWLSSVITLMKPEEKGIPFEQLKKSYETEVGDWHDIYDTDLWHGLKSVGLVVV